MPTTAQVTLVFVLREIGWVCMRACVCVCRGVDLYQGFGSKFGGLWGDWDNHGGMESRQDDDKVENRECWYEHGEVLLV